MINVFFFEHRKNFFPLLEYIVNKIKPENKKLIKFFFLMTHDIDFSFNTNVQYEIIYKNWKILDQNMSAFNMYDKIKYMIEIDSEYCIKMEEDIIFSNYVWDYIIENRHIVKEKDVITLSPIVNIASYMVEFFIDTFCPEKRKQIEEIILQTEYDDNIHMIKNDKKLQKDLNSCTINAKEWNYHNFLNVLKVHKCYNQLHPITRTIKGSNIIIKIILENINKFLSKQNYSIIDYEQLNPLLFSTEIYLCDPEKLRKNYYECKKRHNRYVTDEGPLHYTWTIEKYKHMIIKNSYALHTYYTCLTIKQTQFEQQEIHDIILQKIKEI